MLIAAAAALLYLFGGSGGDGWFGQLMTKYAEDAIKNTISDEGRRERVLEDLSLLKSDYKEFNNLISEETGALEKLVDNYESRPEDFENNFAAMLASRQEILDKLWQDRSNMLVNIKPEEWKKIISSAKAAAQADKE